MAKLTDAELRKIIQEEIGDLDEGWLDRMKARAAGRMSQAGSLGSNIKKGMGDFVRKNVGGSDDFESSRRSDTKNVRRLAGAKSIINTYAKRIESLNDEMKEDFEELEKLGIKTSGFAKIMQQLSSAVTTLQSQVASTKTGLEKEKGE